jgi:hypothetical protein
MQFVHFKTVTRGKFQDTSAEAIGSSGGGGGVPFAF